MTNLKLANLIMLLAIVKGLLREKIEAICKMRFVFVDFDFPISILLFLVPISMDNQEFNGSKTIVLVQDLVAICLKLQLASKSIYSTLSYEALY